MTLIFDCDPSAVGSEATYQRLVDHIEQRAGQALNVGSTRWFIPRKRRYRSVQEVSILKSGLFDAELYLSTYKDVAVAEIDPLLHYIESGDAEGRWPNAFFDPIFYRTQFKAVGRWPFTALHHYIVSGELGGLKPCAAFDPERYREGNPELGPWIDRPLAHFLWLGRHHGLSPTRRRRWGATQRVVVERVVRPLSISPVNVRRGVNIIGPLDRVGGVGVSARGYLDGLKRSGFGPVGARVQRREFTAQLSNDSGGPFPDLIPRAAINVVHMGGDTLPLMRDSPDGALLADRYNIAVWYWELPTLRPEWRSAMDLFHEFWAPTPFVARAISQLTAKPVRLVPPYLAHLLDASAVTHVNPAKPHFVYCFDANSVVERKNPVLLLDAFKSLFRDDKGSHLTFKITHPNRHMSELQRLYEASLEWDNIDVIDRLATESQLVELVASATAYVSPHRSEGLGLTVVEAMAQGTPVIATAFGGLDWLTTSDAAFPIDYRLIEIARDCHPYSKGNVWADPMLESLTAALRQVAEEPEAARRRAVVARRNVIANFASNAVIESYSEALEGAAIQCGLPSKGAR